MRDKYEDETKCPDCNGEKIAYKYADCLCHRTYEGNGRTCWTYPICLDCGYTAGPGAANSTGGAWRAFGKMKNADGYHISKMGLERLRREEEYYEEDEE